ncbi:preprotein translocase subunit SecG [Candidatus Ornithobacterium hominis]|uniref:preprotein translocase subunit SecG n=1 Tax=Candidatus Ornithobacterium hominis TaxID=2497989 RepID=UPI0024BC352E|nr:preprotein translocase subunit SecG [Candidatus Ornithobacterium hominis]CAI9430046.1 preprotein translocase subunit SecG [Candidatus Ornithobacterium hominis]
MGTFIFLMIAIIAVCVLLVLVILSQNPKGGGLSSTFGGGGSQMFGVQRTNDFLDKATWTLSSIICALVILATVMVPREEANATPIPATPPTPEQTETTQAPTTDATPQDAPAADFQPSLPESN